MRRDRGDRGAVALITAGIMVVLLGMAAFTVDLGMQRVAVRDMQAVSDIVALDVSRQLDSATTASVLLGSTTFKDAVKASGARNIATALGSAPTMNVEVGKLVGTTFTSYGSVTYSGSPASVSAPISAQPLVPNAVQVTSSSVVGFGFARVLGVSSGGASGAAIAVTNSSACFALGSFAASVTPANSPLFQSLLGPLLGNSTLTAVGYNGLATTSVTLGDVLRAPSLNIGTVSGVLSSGPVTLSNLYLAEATALTKDGKTAQADVLRLAAMSAVASMTISLPQLLGLSTATDAVLTTRFNALDLLVGSAFLANGNSLVGVPNLQAGLPSVGVTNTTLNVIERPQQACGTDDAKTAQIALTSDAKLSLAIPVVKTPLIDLSLTGADGKPNGNINLHLNASVGGAHGHLTSVTCAPDVFTADIYTDLLQLALTGSAHLTGSVKVDLTVLGVTLVGVDVPVSFDINLTSDASKPASTSPTVTTYSVPPKTYGTPATVNGSLTPVLPHLGVTLKPGSLVAGPVTVKVLLVNVVVPSADLLSSVTPVVNTAVGLVATTVAPLVDPLIDKINGIVGPLADGLGINIAGADMFGLPYPSCRTPRLVG